MGMAKCQVLQFKCTIAKALQSNRLNRITVHLQLENSCGKKTAAIAFCFIQSYLAGLPAIQRNALHINKICTRFFQHLQPLQ